MQNTRVSWVVARCGRACTDVRTTDPCVDDVMCCMQQLERVVALGRAKRSSHILARNRSFAKMMTPQAMKDLRANRKQYRLYREHMAARKHEQEKAARLQQKQAATGHSRRVKLRHMRKKRRLQRAVYDNLSLHPQPISPRNIRVQMLLRDVSCFVPHHIAVFCCMVPYGLGGVVVDKQPCVHCKARARVPPPSGVQGTQVPVGGGRVSSQGGTGHHSCPALLREAQTGG